MSASQLQSATSAVHLANDTDSLQTTQTVAIRLAIASVKCLTHTCRTKLCCFICNKTFQQLPSIFRLPRLISDRLDAASFSFLQCI